MFKDDSRVCLAENAAYDPVVVDPDVGGAPTEVWGWDDELACEPVGSLTVTLAGEN